MHKFNKILSINAKSDYSNVSIMILASEINNYKIKEVLHFLTGSKPINFCWNVFWWGDFD